MIEPVLVIGQPLIVPQACPDLLGQEFGHGGHFAGEAPPAGQRGELPVLVADDGVHQRLSASLNGSKTPSGITSASGVPPPGGSGWAGVRAAPLAGAPALAACGGVTALVRAATRRSRLGIFAASRSGPW